MKLLRRILGGILVFCVTLAVCAGLIGFWVHRNPLEAFHLVQKQFLPADLKIEWKRVQFQAGWLGGIDFNIDLAFDGLDISKDRPNFSAPLEHLRIRASVFPIRRKVTIHILEASATKTILFRSLADVQKGPERNPFQQIQSAISILKLIHQRVPIEAVDLKMEELAFYSSAEEPLKIKAALHQGAGTPMSISVVLKQTEGVDLAVDGAIDFAKLDSTEVFLTAEIRMKGFGVTTTQKMSGVYSDEMAKLTTEGPLDFKNEKLRLNLVPRLTGNFKSNSAELSLVTSLRGVPGPIRNFGKIEIALKTPLESGESWSDKASEFSIATPLELSFIDNVRRAKLETACNCKIPKTVMAHVDGKIWLRTLLTGQTAKRPAIDANLRIDTIQNRVLTLDLAGRLMIEKEKSGFLYFPQLNCTASISHFKAIHPILDVFNYLIPAPLDVLDGTVNISIIGPVETDPKGSTLPIAVDADLKSSSQKVKVSTTATVLVDPKFKSAHFDVQAKVAALNLDLPPLDPLGGLPRVAADSRFRSTPEVKTAGPAKFKVSFNFAVETLSDGAIRLASKYFLPYLPLTLKIQSNGARENSGFIQSEPFNITYLRRTVKVESLRIGLDSDDTGIFPLRGRFSVKQTDYTVFIDVEGTTKNPNVTMSSEPYLPQNDIIAVLLYDRVNDQLVSGDAETSGGVQAAIADRAIGLFGLWAFAATPIKSFSYNPVTKVYTATVAVSEDLTAGIGTNWEASAHLELRKRVSKRWSLTAAWTPATQEENATTKLVLQWEKRF